jgi:hypothetical protein
MECKELWRPEAIYRQNSLSRSVFFWDIIGHRLVVCCSLLLMFWENLLIPSSRVKQSKKNSLSLIKSQRSVTLWTLRLGSFGVTDQKSSNKSVLHSRIKLMSVSSIKLQLLTNHLSNQVSFSGQVLT